MWIQDMAQLCHYDKQWILVVVYLYFFNYINNLE